MRVYLSSTTLDMKPWRLAAAEVVREFGGEPICMDFAANSFTPTAVDASLKEIPNADLFLAIVGWRRGYVPVSGGPSITQMELREAQKHRRSCIAFVADKNTFPIVFMEKEGDAPEQVEQFHRDLNCDRIDLKFDADPNLPEFRRLVSGVLQSMRSEELIRADLGDELVRLKRVLSGPNQDWTLGRRVGSGDFGDVYEITDSAKIKYALKLYRRRLDTVKDVRGRARFLRGVHALTRLREDAEKGAPIIEIIGREDFSGGCLRYLMKYAAEGRLSDYLLRDRPSLEKRLELYRQIVEAICIAHEKKPPIYHGDLTPDNILIDEKAHARVSDFELGADEDLTGSLTPITKLAFRPPEERDASSASTSGLNRDLWSLGAMLHFILVGQVSWSQTERLEQRHRLLKEGNEGLRGALGVIIEWMLAIDAKRRPANARIVAEVIDAVLQKKLSVALEKIGSRSDQLLWDQLVTDAEQWAVNGDASLLWSGERLIAAVEASERRAPLSTIVVLFLERSRAREEEAKQHEKLAKEREQRRNRTSLAAAILVFLILTWSTWSKFVDLRDNIGEFALVLRPFDWSANKGRASTSTDAELPARLAWRLYALDRRNPTAPGELLQPEVSSPSTSEVPHTKTERAFLVSAPGGSAILEVFDRGALGENCGSIFVPLYDLPGFRESFFGSHAVEVPVPTCQASREGTVLIPEGPYIAAGVGQPPVPLRVSDGRGGEFAPEIPAEHTVQVDEYRIQTTEVTNAAFSKLVEMAKWTLIATPTFATTDSHLTHAGSDNYPVSFVDFPTARTFCRFWGLDLPTVDQWQKAGRGALGSETPDNKSYPWVTADLLTTTSTSIARGYANLKGLAKPGDESVGLAPVGSSKLDRSVYGVFDLGGNLSEWTLTPRPEDSKTQHEIRGGNWDFAWDTYWQAIQFPNYRTDTSKFYYLGFRCATPLKMN